eukprot:12908517-Prorocentrum_lima.AAC.1
MEQSHKEKGSKGNPGKHGAGAVSAFADCEDHDQDNPDDFYNQDWDQDDPGEDYGPGYQDAHEDYWYDQGWDYHGRWDGYGYE